MIRDDGSAGSMFVDPATDPETRIDSFSQTSTACVRFGGIARLNTGELWDFFVDACDNASPVGRRR